MNIRNFGDRDAHLSPFSSHSIVVDNISFDTVYRYYTYMKFKDSDSKWAAAVLNIKSEKTLVQMGATRRHAINNKWDSVKYAIMKRGMVEKYNNHPKLKTKLLAVKSTDLRYTAHTGFKFWSFTGGNNMMGRLVLEIKNEFINAAKKPGVKPVVKKPEVKPGVKLIKKPEATPVVKKPEVKPGVKLIKKPEVTPVVKKPDGDESIVDDFFDNIKRPLVDIELIRSKYDELAKLESKDLVRTKRKNTAGVNNKSAKLKHQNIRREAQVKMANKRRQLAERAEKKTHDDKKKLVDLEKKKIADKEKNKKLREAAMKKAADKAALVTSNALERMRSIKPDKPAKSKDPQPAKPAKPAKSKDPQPTKPIVTVSFNHFDDKIENAIYIPLNTLKEVSEDFNSDEILISISKQLNRLKDTHKICLIDTSGWYSGVISMLGRALSGKPYDESSEHGTQVKEIMKRTSN